MAGCGGTDDAVCPTPAKSLQPGEGAYLFVCMCVCLCVFLCVLGHAHTCTRGREREQAYSLGPALVDRDSLIYQKHGEHLLAPAHRR